MEDLQRYRPTSGERNFIEQIKTKNLSKILDISITTTWVVKGLIKALEILSDTTVIRSAVDWKDLKSYWKSKKRPYFCRWSTSQLFTGFFEDFTNHRKKTFPNTLNTETIHDASNNLENKTASDTYWRVQLICMTANIYVQFYRTTTGINSGPHALWWIKNCNGLNHGGSYRNIMQFQIDSRMENT